MMMRHVKASKRVGVEVRPSDEAQRILWLLLHPNTWSAYPKEKEKSQVWSIFHGGSGWVSELVGVMK